MAAMNPLTVAGAQAGDSLAQLCDIAGRRIWHQRVVAHVLAGETATASVLAPELDEYDEKFAVKAGVAAWCSLVGRCIGRGSAQLGADYIHRFRALPLVFFMLFVIELLFVMALLPASPSCSMWVDVLA